MNRLLNIPGIRFVGALLLAAPIGVGAVLLTRDVRTLPITHAPTNEDVPADTPIGPLKEGDRHVVTLPASDVPLAGVVLLAGTYITRPTVTFEVCSAGRCDLVEQEVENNAPLFLPLPPESRGGEVSVTIQALREGKLAFWGHEGRARALGALHRGWTRPLSRARGYFAAYGADLFWPMLGASALTLVGLLGLAVWRGLADRERPEAT